MSDIIPPLISSTPPPMPEFDDDEDDDDDDAFGMTNGISDLGLDFQDAVRENKDKILDLERRGRGQEVEGEGDSASQDSGVGCMASQGSEGEGGVSPSPLPHSDDDERGDMRHSATVIFDKNVAPDTGQTPVTNDRCDIPHSATDIFDKSVVPDTGQSLLTNDDHRCDDILHSATDIFDKSVVPDTGQPPTAVTEDRSDDDEFGNWTVAADNVSKDQSRDGVIPNGFANHCTNDELPSSLESSSISKTTTDLSGSHSTVHSPEVSSSVDDKCVVSEPHSTIHSPEETSVNGKYVVDCVRNTFNETSGDCIADDSIFSQTTHTQFNVETSDDCIPDDSTFPQTIHTQFNVGDCIPDDSTFSQSTHKTQFECEPRTNDDESDFDDFGNFESVTVVNHNLNSVEVETSCNVQAVDDDSFGDFSEFSEPVIVDSRNEICENIKEGPSLDSNLASSESVDKPVSQRPTEHCTEVSEERLPVDDDDEFDDFSDFTQSQVVEHTTVVDSAAPAEDDDEFNDFSDFTQSQAVETIPVRAGELACGSHSITSQDGFEDIFPKEGAETEDAKTEDLGKGPIWQQLCPLESSPALSFQWPNSTAHTKLLSALNIDSRNILFGPKWNAKIPRFAANLGSNPLQPVKAAEPSPVTPPTINQPSPEATVPAQQPLTVQNEQETVPDAHFDWVGSGLTNPLDYAHRTTAHKSEEIVDSNSSKKLNKLDNLNVLSSEAEKIISQLPDLNFMKKTYIEVLISKV